MCIADKGHTYFFGPIGVSELVPKHPIWFPGRSIFNFPFHFIQIQDCLRNKKNIIMLFFN